MEPATRRRFRRLRRSALAVGLVIYAHAAMAAGVLLVILSPGIAGVMAGVALLAALTTLGAVALGTVMGSRMTRAEPPLPPIAAIDAELSGAADPMADDIQEQLDQMGESYAPMPYASFGLTAEESRT